MAKDIGGHDLYDVNEGLIACHTCGGGEGSLPTECPKKHMNGDTQEAVYAGWLDFRRGRWWVAVPKGVNL